MKTKYSLACYAIVLIILLRVGIGWHFFYEGVNKFDPNSNFSAEGFLGIAKGPTAELYYWMLPDIDGVNRLELIDIRDENDNIRKTFRQYDDAWKEYFEQYLLASSPLIENKEDAETVVGLGTEDFAEWVKKNVTPAVAENIIALSMNQTPAQLKTRLLEWEWVQKGVPIPVAAGIVARNMAVTAEQFKKDLTSWAKTASKPLADTEIDRMAADFDRMLADVNRMIADIDRKVAEYGEITSVPKRVEWAKTNIPLAVDYVVKRNAAPLNVWAETRVPSAEAANRIISERLEFNDWKEWADKNLAPADVTRLTNSRQAQFKDWMEQYFPLAVAEDVIAMEDAQLADWAERNTPVTDTKKGDDVQIAKNLVRAKTIFNRYLNAMRAEAADLEQEIYAFRGSRDRFLETRRTIRNDASFEQERRWRQMMGFRLEAGYLTRLLSAMGDGMQSDLGRLADPELAGQSGQIITAPKRGLFPDNPLIQVKIPEVRIPVVDANIKSRLHVLDWAVTFGLTAIGLCLMVGFCTRLAALGGVIFLINVLLTTYPVPGVYPAIPSLVGNFMFVSKDMVELLALLVLMAVPSGRWGGLDYFLWHYGGKQIVGFCFRSKEDKDKTTT